MDEIVQGRFRVQSADRAIEVRGDLVQGTEAVHRVAARRADEVPFHLEHSLPGAVEKHVDGLALRDAAVRGEPQWIDAKELLVISRANEGLQLFKDFRR